MTLYRLLFVSLLLNVGCAPIWYSNANTDFSNTELNSSQSKQTNKVPKRKPRSAPPHYNAKTQQLPETTFSTPDVEVIWAIPSSPVERYTIRYGYNRSALTESVTVNVNSLEKYEDPQHGFVYRYILKGIPENRTVYVSLTARSNSASSPPSPIFEIPGKN